MIDSAPALQQEIPDGTAADKFLATTRFQAEHVDPNDILYSLKSSFSYDPEPGLSRISTRLFALNFSDDEFNPDTLRVLERLVPKLQHARYVVQQGTPSSPGHFTMTRPDLWAQHVDEFMQWLGDASSQAGGRT
jgi:homoserine O-acetyltransferase